MAATVPRMGSRSFEWVVAAAVVVALFYYFRKGTTSRAGGRRGAQRIRREVYPEEDFYRPFDLGYDYKSWESGDGWDTAVVSQTLRGQSRETPLHSNAVIRSPNGRVALAAVGTELRLLALPDPLSVGAPLSRYVVLAVWDPHRSDAEGLWDYRLVYNVQAGKVRLETRNREEGIWRMLIPLGLGETIASPSTGALAQSTIDWDVRDDRTVYVSVSPDGERGDSVYLGPIIMG